MKNRRMYLAPALITMALSLFGFCMPQLALASEYNRQCSVTGGTAQKLSDVLSTCGYSGVTNLDELSLKDPDAAANDLYIGQSDEDGTKGYQLHPGDSKTWRASGVPIQVDRMYVYVATTQNVMISLRSK